MTSARITVLVENTAGGRNLLAEHGLSIGIDCDGRRVLFDTGQGHVLSHNARALGLDLRAVDAVVLSHGHYDHTGGLADVPALAPHARLYAHPAAFEPKYSQSPDGTIRPAGVPSAVDGHGWESAERIMIREPMQIGEHLWLTGPIPRVTAFEDTGGRFFKDPEGTETDDLADDMAAFITTPEGTVVILGCAHAGVVNTLRYVRELTDDQPIHTVIGGMHLLNAGPERLDRTVAALRELDVKHLLPCHCTGFAATARLWHTFPERLSTCRVGSKLHTP